MNRVNVLLFVSRCFWTRKKIHSYVGFGVQIRRIIESLLPPTLLASFHVLSGQTLNIHQFSTANNPLTWLSQIITYRVLGILLANCAPSPKRSWIFSEPSNDDFVLFCGSQSQINSSSRTCVGLTNALYGELMKGRLPYCYAVLNILCK